MSATHSDNFPEVPLCLLSAPHNAAPLFSGWDETLIWSCLDGSMGEIYADAPSLPKSAQAHVGDFCFFAGAPSAALVRNRPAGHPDFMILVPQNEDWSTLIEQEWPAARRHIRYATRKEGDLFHRSALRRMADTLPEGVHLRPVDAGLYARLKQLGWCRDLCGRFADDADYLARGLGVVALAGDEILAGASSYTVYRGGIEIEIDTREDLRRRGLALACGAQLILNCLERGLYPSWDAQNRGSLALAEKLGYHFSHEYPSYELNGYH